MLKIRSLFITSHMEFVFDLRSLIQIDGLIPFSCMDSKSRVNWNSLSVCTIHLIQSVTFDWVLPNLNFITRLITQFWFDYKRTFYMYLLFSSTFIILESKDFKINDHRFIEIWTK